MVEEERGTNDGREKPISAVGPDSQRQRREAEWKEKCYKKLKKRRNARIAKNHMVRAKIIISCKNCEGMYHQKCAKLTKDVLEKKAKYGEWICGECRKGKPRSYNEEEKKRKAKL